MKLKTAKGFTLIEMLLVMAIIAGIVVGIATYSQQRMDQLRMDRAVLQTQQILNAGLAYYLNNTTWPKTIEDDLQGDGTVGTGGYLPGPSTAVQIVNPWGSPYIIGRTTATNAPNALFAVCTTLNAGAATPTLARILAGRLPMAYVVAGDQTTCTPPPAATECTEAPCTVISTVNVPGQNLNNARSVNFAGIYHNGACVAAPKCPAKMVPTIMVAPTSVSGMNNGTGSVSPISSFTANTSSTLPPSVNPAACPNDSPGTTEACPKGGVDDVYWRVCLQIITQQGLVTYDKNTAPTTALMAVTRCMPQNEDTTGTVSGSDFNVFSY